MVADRSNLFVYGTLKDPCVFRAVTGHWFEAPGARDQPEPGRAPGQSARTLAAGPASLADHELASPDKLFFYATPRAGGRIDGLLLRDVPEEALVTLVDYEGPAYRLSAVTVATPSGPARARAFLAAGRLRAVRPEQAGLGRLKRLKAEFAFRARVTRFLADQAAGKMPATALAELKGATVNDLVRAQFQAPGLSDFFIRQALAGPIGSLEPIRHHEDALLFAESYLAWVLRQVVFNQFEQQVFERFRYEIDRLGRGDRYYERAISSLVALRMLAGLGPLLGTLVSDGLNDLDCQRHELTDYVQWAVDTAAQVFEPASAREALAWIGEHRTGGLLPLGVHLELSNLPHGALSPALGESAGGFDPAYDSFRHFAAFALDRLCWKLGGNVRPARALGDRPGPHGRGWLVFSLGATGTRVERMRALSSDPWLVSQLIRHVLGFCDVLAHSLRVSIHLPHAFYRRRGGVDRRPRAVAATRDILPESAIRCLLALAGDAGPDLQGRPQVRRLALGEIVSLVPVRGLDFLHIVRRLTRGAEEESAATGLDMPVERTRPVAQYSFARLARGVDYEPFILALKGVQLRYRPAEMLTSKQMQADPELARMFDSLLAWGRRPEPISQADSAEFLQAVHDGLMTERLGKPAHSAHHIEWAVGQLAGQIEQFNHLVRPGGAAAKGGSGAS